MANSGPNAASTTAQDTFGGGGPSPSVTKITTSTTITGASGAETPTTTVITSTISTSSTPGATSPSIVDTEHPTHSPSQNKPSQAQSTAASVPTSTQTASSTSAAAAGITNGPNSSDVKNNTSYSVGVLAGAVVASLIGAAIITFLITWLLFRKRNQRNQRSHRSGSRGNRDHRSPGRHDYSAVAAAGVKEKSSSSSGDSGYSWQAYLPQGADDQTIKRDVKTLFDQIELHVDNYYTKANIQLDSGTREALSQFNDDSLPDSIEALMANPQTTLPTIKHCIARTLIARMSPGHERTSLLPTYLAAEPTRLSSSMPPAEQTAAQQAYSQLRLLNAYLHPRPDQDRDYQQQRENVSKEISNDLSDTFGAWQGLQENLAGLKQHERSLVMRAADVATLIMSQPSAYEFWWSSSSQAFVVFPGFFKSTDERGKTLDQPQTLIQPAPAR